MNCQIFQKIDEAKQIDNDVQKGIITPKQYANKILEFEATAIVNKIKVASELKIGDERNQTLIDEYSSGEMSVSELTEHVKSGLSTATLKDGGGNAMKNYIKNGKQMLEDYLKANPNTDKEK